MQFASTMILAVASALSGFAAHAQPAYPAKTMRIVVPLAPGGNVDIVVRALAQTISENIGQQIIIENRPGASSLVGTQYVAKIAPDGYTLLAVANTFAMVPSIVTNPGYDPFRDFAAITMTCQVPQVLVVNPALPVRTVKELVALAKARPGELSYATSGPGGTGHMATELFEDITFNGLVAPAGTPREMRVRIQQEVAKAAGTPRLRDRFIERGVELKASANPEEFGALIKTEFDKKAKLAREANIRID